MNRYESGSGSSSNGGTGKSGSSSSRNSSLTKCGSSQRKAKSSKTRVDSKTSSSSQTSRSSRTSCSSKVTRSPRKCSSAQIPCSSIKGSSRKICSTSQIRTSSKAGDVSDDNSMSRRDSDSYLSIKSGDSLKAGGSCKGSASIKSLSSTQYEGSWRTFDTPRGSGSSTTRSSSAERIRYTPCVTHGPSRSIKLDGQFKCSRCVKRPMRTRMEKYEPVTKISDMPVSIASLDKQRKLEHIKTIRYAYSQVTTVPVELGKTTGTLRKEQDKRLRQKDEKAEMMSRRNNRMMEICQAYELTWPYFYSPFGNRPAWLKQRQCDMSEYLHNVQAVVQSLERRDNLKSLADMKKRTNNLYRTTKKAAWRVVYIREDFPPSLDILHDQDAAASYKDCLRKICQTAGPRPKSIIMDNCGPSYSNKARATGRQRLNSIFTYRAKKYNLQTYRNQASHKYSTTYMVKSIIWMNQVLFPRRSGKRNFTIAKQLRTVLIVRKLFQSHKENFRRHLKLFLAEHATGLDDPKVQRKWKKFLETGEPPDKAREVLALVAAVDKAGTIARHKVRKKSPPCDQCQVLKESIKQTAREIAKVKCDIKVIKSREKRTLDQEATEPSPTISVTIKARSKEAAAITESSSKPKSQQGTVLSNTSLARKIVSDVYTQIQEDKSTTVLSNSSLARKIVSDVYKQIQEGKNTTALSNTSLAGKIVSDVYKQIQEGKSTTALSNTSLAGKIVSDVYKQIQEGKNTIALSNTSLAGKIVSDVYKQIQESKSSAAAEKVPSIVEAQSSSLRDAAPSWGHIDSDTSLSNATLASQIVSNICSRIEQEQGKTDSANISSLAESFSDTASRWEHTDSDTTVSSATLVSQIISNVLSQIEQDKGMSTAEIASVVGPQPMSSSDTGSQCRHMDSNTTVSNTTLASQIISNVFSQIEQDKGMNTAEIASVVGPQPMSSSDTESRFRHADSNTTVSSTTLASQIISNILSQIEQDKAMSTTEISSVAGSQPMSSSDTGSRFCNKDSKTTVSNTTLASQIISNIYSQIEHDKGMSTAAISSVAGAQSKSGSDTTSPKMHTDSDAALSTTTLANQIVSNVFLRLEQDKEMSPAEILSLVGPQLRSSSEIASRIVHTDRDTTLSNTTLANKIVSNVYSQIEQDQILSTAEMSSLAGTGSRTFSDNASNREHTSSDTASINTTLASEIVSNVYSRIEQDKGMSSAEISSNNETQSKSFSDTSSGWGGTVNDTILSNTTLADNIITDVYKRIEHSSLSGDTENAPTSSEIQSTSSGSGGAESDNSRRDDTSQDELEDNIKTNVVLH